MTRAQQTISLALLVTSVHLPQSQILAYGLANSATFLSQVYLAFALHLVPVNAKIQDEIIPFVLAPFQKTASPQGLSFRLILATAPFVVASIFRVLALIQVGMGRFHLQRCPASA